MAEQSRHAKDYTRSSHPTQEVTEDEQHLSVKDIELTNLGQNIKAAKSTVPHKAESSPWVYGTFKKKRCSRYIPCKKKPDRCGCGRSKVSHGKEITDGPTNRLTEPGQETSAIEWKVSEHTEIDGPTNAFGELEFTGAGQASRAKFIRISDDTDPDDVLHLLQEKWKLELPRLVISVTGGAKSFVMHPKLKDLFRQGLLKAAKTTGAWIITGGTNTGVMKHVGKAVKGHTVMSRGAMLTDKTSQVHLIGIAPWGIVEHRSELIGETQDVVTYHMTSSLQIQGSCIDNNHSHFLLVDDGTEGKYGGEIAFRARLQNCLSKKEISKTQTENLDENSQESKSNDEHSQKSESNGIPVVLVVLEGGLNTIRTVLGSVKSTPAVPVVIADGSGRAADILAYAYSLYKANEGFDMKHFPEVAEHEILKLRIEKAFPKSSEKEWSECYSNVLECVKKSQYITIFHMDDDGIDFDKSILKAILKAQSASPSYQLDLALTWNRADIARTEIFTKDQKWEMETLEDKMKDALIRNRVEFVDLLLEKGVSMRKFLTTDRLNNLFKAVTRQGLPSRVVLEELIGKAEIDDEGFNFLDVIEALWPHLWGTHQGDDNICPVTLEMSIAKDPYQALLLWSVLSNMQKMALFMWERGEKNLARALIAGKVYKLMARLTRRDDAKADVTDELTANFEEFKRLSVAFLDQCFRTNKDRTKQLLIYNLENWGGQSCLSLAYAIDHEEFIAHVSCQSVLTEIWTGYMRTSQNSSLKIVLGLLIPTTVLSLEFHQLPEKQKNLGKDNPSFRPEVPENGGNEGSEKGNIFSASKFDPNIVWREKEKGSRWRKLTWREKFIAFYHAPATKFWANLFDYMLFLALFSYVVLVRQDKIPSIGEIVLIIFVCTLCAEEIRQILHSEPPTLKNKFKAWASSYWNRLDGLAVVSFFIGLGLRLYSPTRDAGHVVYCFDAAMWIMRLLHFFYVSKHMGPYVVMIGRMTVDLMYFLLIMVVFFLAYGIPQQAILYPNEGPSWSMASRVFFRPYFQAHGELFLDAPDIIENTTTVFGTARKDSYGDTVVSFMTAIYLLVVNILLLNLLIAVFNNTYEKVQTNATQIWMFERYYLVTEYKQRPVLVPPFIILNHVIYALRFLYRSCFKKCCNRNGNQDDAGNSYDNNMKIFEERCVDEYLREKNALLRATQEEQIRVINDSMGSVSSQLQDVSRFVDQRFKKVDEDLSKVLKKLDLGSRRPSIADLLTVKTATKDNSKKSPSEEHTTHVRARQSPYPKSCQQRTFVPDVLVAWQESFPGYDPPSYTAQETQALPTGADTDIMEPSNSSYRDRNPVGRTGLSGRGLLSRWGPNPTAYFIITRWKVGKDEKIVQKKGKQVLEFLAIKSLKDVKWAMGWKSRKDGNNKGRNYLELMPVENPEANLEWKIPGGMMEVGDSVLEALIKSMRKTIVPSLKPTIAKDILEHRLNAIIQKAKEVYQGYVDDPRNTDNAWLETVVRNFHDDTGTALGVFEFEEKVGAYSVNWQEVSSQINLQANLSFILHKVAMLKNAFF